MIKGELKMKDKRKINSIFNFKSILLSLALIFLIEATADAKTIKWSSDGSQWSDRTGNVYYLIDDTLYVSEIAPHSMGSRDKVAGWKLKDGEYLKIVNGYKNKIYINHIDELNGKSILYSVNVTTKKKTKEVSNCCITTSKGKFMYGDKSKATDSGAYPLYIWKITGNSIKKLKTMGKYTFGTTVVKNKVYYASYPDSSQKKMTVYCCNLDGSNSKKLFTFKGKGSYCQVLISDVNEKTITVYVSGENPAEYVYTIKTGNLKKI